MLCCRAVLPRMLESNEGIIINVIGGGALSPLVGASAYASSKAAVVRLTDTLAGELERSGSAVLAFAVDPGFNWTDMTEQLASHPGVERWMPHVREFADNRDAARNPQECARTAVELVRNAGPWLNGGLFFADDDVAAIRREGKRIVDEDLLVLRLRSLE